MRRLPAILLMLLLPLAAAGQSVGHDSTAEHLLAHRSDKTAQTQPAVAVPLWRGKNGRQLTLKAEHRAGVTNVRSGTPLAAHVVDATSVLSTGLQYNFAPNLQAHAEVNEHLWNNQSSRLLGSELGASYAAGRYSVDVSVGANSAPGSAALPRVLAGAEAGVDGLPGFDSSAQLNARGRVALGSQSGIDLGASTGRIRLLPGNLLGVSTLDQKTLSFGIDHGPLSGALVGRSLQPQAGIPGGFNPDRSWNSIDLGVTWRLPWRGQLSVGAQNLWSSGTPVNTPVGPEPDQSRTPYVQYHQDL
jgi:hypothetical protein